MNELDFDKLFSMEEPEPLPKIKKTPEPDNPVPDTPPEPEAPPEQDESQPKRPYIPILLIAMLVIGFAAGIWARRAQNADDPTIPPYTSPPYTTTAPATQAPGITESLVSEMVYRDKDITCWAYQEPIAIDYRQTDTAIWDGAQLSLPIGWAGMQGAFSEHIYNVWLRVELSDESRDTLGDQDLNASLGSDAIAVLPYRELYSDEPDGWFLLARIDHTELAYLSIGGTSDERYLGMDPVFTDGNLAFYTTGELIDLVFAQSELWSDSLPDNLQDNILLKNLMKREDRNDLLLDTVRKIPTHTNAQQAKTLVQHNQVWPTMTPQQRDTFYKLTDTYFLAEVYSFPLKIVTHVLSAGDHQSVTTVFEYNDTYWLVDNETPAELAGIPEEELNFFIRVDLLDHTREQYGDALSLLVKGMYNSSCAIGIREYYDGEGLAGWFIYGKIIGDDILAGAIFTLHLTDSTEYYVDTDQLVTSPIQKPIYGTETD